LRVFEQASGVTTTDCAIRRGEWPGIQLDPYIISGTTFVGQIHRKTPAFSGFKAGDKVLSLVRYGANARYSCAPKDKLVKIPPTIHPESAVCLPEIYLGAFQALHLGHRGSVRYKSTSFRGKSILVMAGYTAYGRALIEISLAGGADNCYVVSREKHHAAISRMGAIPLTKHPQDWLTLIGKKISIIITVNDHGLCTENVTQDHLKALDLNGQVVHIGYPGIDHSLLLSNAAASPSRLICKSERHKDRIKSFNVFDSWDNDHKLCKKDLEHLLGLLEEKKLFPEVLERIPLSKVAKAHSILEARVLCGFIVCDPWIKEIV